MNESWWLLILSTLKKEVAYLAKIKELVGGGAGINSRLYPQAPA